MNATTHERKFDMTQDEMANLLFADRIERVIVHPIVPLEVYNLAPESRGFFPVEDTQFGMAAPGDESLGYCPNCGGREYYRLPVFAGDRLIDNFVECLECGF
jgi:predicted RNA-binding Zn-ribbon protein involved in translation (DUF1610 family)